MKRNLEHLHYLLQSIEGIVWEADMEMDQFTFISDRVLDILGFPAEYCLRAKGFWEGRIHHDDKHIVAKYRELLSGKTDNHVFEYRMIKADGSIVWIRDSVGIVYKDGVPASLSGIMVDYTVIERLQALERLEGDMLRMNSDLSIPLEKILLTYLAGLEALFPKMLCTIHYIRNWRLTGGLSPSLPPEYMNTISGLVIGKNEGSCGAAAATKQRVVVDDINTHPNWAKYKQLAEKYKLRACWSTPVLNSGGEVIAVLAMYYHEPKQPTEEEIKVMERSTVLLQVIMENRHNTEVIKESNLLMLQSQDLARFGNWRWDVQHDLVTWSPALYTIYGLDQHNFKATFAGYQERLHPDDRDRTYQTINNVLRTGTDASFEERIIRPTGEIRYLRSWAKLKKDANGQPLEMIGACLDITESVTQRKAIEQQNQQLVEIAWVQAHVVRSPLARILSLVELLKTVADEDLEKGRLLEHLQSSAMELDEQIRLICEKTEATGNN
jgi:PAS domain S-box-containing protein